MLGVNLSLTQIAAASRPYSPLSLFSANEPGVFFDYSDLSTMFQDASGSTPVTSVEQPIGLVLDKSRGLALGSELVSNPGGPFTSTTGYATTNATVSVVNGKLRVTNTNSFGRARISITTVVGQWYVVTTAGSTQITGSDGSYLAKADDTGNAVNAVYGSPTRLAFVATATTTYISLQSSTSGNVIDWNNLSVVSLAGSHASQSTSASRPVLQQDANGLYYLLFDGADDSLSTPPIDFSGTDKVSFFAGVRKLSTAQDRIIAELSANSNTNNGAFWFLSEFNAENSKNYSFQVRGSANNASQYDTYTVPITNVASAQLTTAAANVTAAINARFNGVAVTRTAGKGVSAISTGNFGHYPLYIGRRNNVDIPFNGRLYSLIVRGAASSDAQIASTESWLNQRTGAY